MKCQIIPIICRKLFSLSLIGIVSVGALSGQDIQQNGKASYYSRKFQGNVTASGDIFDTYDYTAAHRSLPFNTYVNVTNTANKLNVIVRINDRGPYAKSRIIDLSEAAARRIGGYQHGVVHVKLEVLDILQLTPAIDSIFNSGGVHDCLGNKAEFEGKSLSLWRTFDLLHALYVANDLYIKEDVSKVYLIAKRDGGRNLYHIVLSGFNTDEALIKAKEMFEQKGFMEVEYFYP
ncbi:MAG TPA: septal ring lytic transglycosylase RlpA family protein [Bacteroidia bacterium]|nr:septal ring lytic transglycosylase RlpA family protein [Bacteroidia bacterium]